MEILCVAKDASSLIRPCVDCGTRTGRFCDGIPRDYGAFIDCFAADRCPSEQWETNQRTPLCSTCDEAFDLCHFCRENRSELRPCLDCGLVTARMCPGIPNDEFPPNEFVFFGCVAADRSPNELWLPNDLTPLCRACRVELNMCHFCRGEHWCTPPAHRGERCQRISIQLEGEELDEYE